MPNKTSKLELHEGDYEYLHSLTKQRTIQAQVVMRARILMDKAGGLSIRTIASNYDISTNTARLCLDKYAEGGTDSALFDKQRKGRPVEITDDAKPWIINIVCQKPCDLGYSAELWTLTALHKHIMQECRRSRVSSLKHSNKAICSKASSIL